MHEMALAQSIVDLVEEQARHSHFTRVRTIRLSIGALANVDPRSLTFGFEAAASGTVAEGAALGIERTPGQAWCTDCNAAIVIEGLTALCPTCGGCRWILVGGDQMRVVDLEVE